MKTNELKCTDLRIGNWVKRGNILCRIVEIYEEAVYCYDKYGEDSHNINVVEPIELTEELLEKIGFEKFEKMFRMKLSEFHLDYFIAVGVLRIYKKLTDCYFDKNLEIKCEFLHQLQNSFFLLTGKELEVEL